MQVPRNSASGHSSRRSAVAPPRDATPSLGIASYTGAVGYSVRIARAELKEKFEGSLIWRRLQALKHLRPVLFEGIGTATAGLLAQVAVFKAVDNHAAGTGIQTPDFYAFCYGFLMD